MGQQLGNGERACKVAGGSGLMLAMLVWAALGFVPACFCSLLGKDSGPCKGYVASLNTLGKLGSQYLAEGYSGQRAVDVAARNPNPNPNNRTLESEAVEGEESVVVFKNIEDPDDPDDFNPTP